MSYPEKVYLNGKIVNAQEATISVFDRGFIFGDGIYEVMVQINGSFFYGQKHLDRLQEGLDKININFDVGSLTTEIPKLLKATSLTDKDCLLYMQITRGVAPRQHSYPADIHPTVMMYALPKILPNINQANTKVITREDFRWSRCDIKMTSLLGNVMLNEEAMQHGSFETLLYRNGLFTEASHCNVFFVRDQVVYTHPANEYILNGITGAIVKDLCTSLGIALKEIPYPSKELALLDEAFLTGTSTQIAAISQIDNHCLYMGNEKGPITKKLQEAFFNLK
ncbi:aminotransferase class IV [Maribacter confluentis]|uniref:Aminotransferase class IV n=1 Tax=Maribacter confluentis TaxID=1656093 RepID=A0ABT8RLM5_9FLAO|nr:aminotransferase class IV [Maribacter confluentis]MDO1511066.1 aminotransferase class IV [Maribacter confluentis]